MKHQAVRLTFCRSHSSRMKEIFVNLVSVQDMGGASEVPHTVV